MVEYCKTISDRDERLNCAYSIIEVMDKMLEEDEDIDDKHLKLWNHLALIANYELDIDYPVEIIRSNDEDNKPQPIPYPKSVIKRRNYGHVIEEFTRAIKEMENEEDRMELAGLVANQMKRDLGNWNVDAMSDDKVADDLAQYTDGNVILDPSNFHFITDGEILSSLISTSVKKKKKK